MAKKVCIDAGHYGKYNQSPVMKSYYESDMTWKLHNYLADELKKWGVTVVKTRTSQAIDKELVSRGKCSSGCDLFISVHSNAASSEAPNYALCIYMRDNKAETYDDKSKDIATKLAKVIGDTMGVGNKTYCKEYVGDRDGNGKWDDEWYGVLQGAKLVKTPGIIAEHGFHTNLADTKWLSSDKNLQKLAVAEAKCIANWLGIKSKPVKTTYVVQAGAFSSKTTANKKATAIKADGFDAYVKSEDNLFKVQCGAFTTKKYATELVAKLQKAGYSAYVKVVKA